MERVETTPEEYIESQEPEIKAVLTTLHELIKEAFPDQDISLWQGVFWGGSEQSIIGYGHWSYQRSDKKQVDWFMVGLTRQKNYYSVYVNAVEGKKYLTEIYSDRLGKVKTGKSCINIRNIDNVDLDVLSDLIAHAYKTTTENDS